MKITELRIGNWIKSPIESGGKFEKVIRLDSDKDGYNHFIDHCNPIPLTEDILLNCGFEYMYKNEWLSKGMFGIRADLKYFVYGFPTLYTDKELFVCNIKHLHQLQNLYFALTGEELEVNL